MRCALTAPFHPYLRFRLLETIMKAVFSLLHFPSAYTAQALPGTLPYEARTFLPCFSHGDLYTAAIVWLTSRAHFNKSETNCLMFFEQLVFHTSAMKLFLRFWHDSDPVEYNPQDRTTDTAVYHDAQRIPYINLG